jgi:hypothetical protein
VVYTEKHESPNSGKSDFTLFGLNQKSRQSPISFQFRFLLELESIHHEPYIYVARSLFIYSMIPDRQFGRSFGVEAVRTAGWRGRSILDYIPKPLKSLCEFFEKKSRKDSYVYVFKSRETTTATGLGFGLIDRMSVGDYTIWNSKKSHEIDTSK